MIFLRSQIISIRYYQIINSAQFNFLLTISCQGYSMANWINYRTIYQTRSKVIQKCIQSGTNKLKIKHKEKITRIIIPTTFNHNNNSYLSRMNYNFNSDLNISSILLYYAILRSQLNIQKYAGKLYRHHEVWCSTLFFNKIDSKQTFIRV